MSPRSKLASLGLPLPTVSGPFGAYCAGAADREPDFRGRPVAGEGRQAAGDRAGAVALLAGERPDRRPAVRRERLAAVGSLGTDIDTLPGVVRVGAFICSDAGFADQPKVANAASELLLDLFGDAGRHARAAVGVNALPLDASVEIEFIFEGR